MSRYWSYSYTVTTGQTLTQSVWNNVFASLGTAFDAIQTDIDADKTSQVRYSGLTANLNAGGFRITGLPTPAAADEPATRGYADSLAISGLGPTQVGHAGGLATTDGTSASWSDTQGVTIQTIQFAQAMAALAYLNQ